MMTKDQLNDLLGDLDVEMIAEWVNEQDCGYMLMDWTRKDEEMSAMQEGDRLSLIKFGCALHIMQGLLALRLAEVTGREDMSVWESGEWLILLAGYVGARASQDPEFEREALNVAQDVLMLSASGIQTTREPQA